jgi:hypothetical protein
LKKIKLCLKRWTYSFISPKASPDWFFYLFDFRNKCFELSYDPLVGFDIFTLENFSERPMISIMFRKMFRLSLLFLMTGYIQVAYPQEEKSSRYIISMAISV